MDYFQAENNQRSLLELIGKEKSPRVVLVKIIDFLDQVIDNFEPSITEAFICDLLPNLNSLLKKYSPYGFEPRVTKDIIIVLNKISAHTEFLPYIGNIENEIERIKNELNELEKTLKGWKKQIGSSTRVHFPIIEKSNLVDSNFSLLDSLQVTLIQKKRTLSNNFLLHPSAIDVEKRIKTQVEDSWYFAQTYIEEKYKKKIPFFDVIVNFEKQYAIYEGASLGIALTILFISELLNFFDLKDNLFLQNNIVTTGAVQKDGKILEMNKEIIETKLKAVFYSNFSIFLIPKEDENYAVKYLQLLKKNYPQRELEVVGVKNIQEIFNRRDLIEIKSKNLLYRGLKIAIKNKLVVFLAVLFIIHSTTYYFLQIDSNPTNIEFTAGNVLIKNKFNKVLWSKNYNINLKILEKVPDYNNSISRLIDVDSDGYNEVLIVLLKDENTSRTNFYLLDHQGDEIWKFNFTDSIETETEKFTGSFIVFGIIDTVHNYKNNRIELLVYFQHHNFYPSGIVKLDLLTGKKISNVLWHPGSIVTATLMDWNGDGKKEIIAGGASNGMRKAFLFSIDHDKLNGTFPTAENYFLKDVQLADFNNYLLFPQTDYSLHFFPKYNAVTIINRLDNNLLHVTVSEGKANLSEAEFTYSIRLNKNMKPEKIVIGDGPVVIRDKLINEGILQPPFTDTYEFTNSIKNNIEYWDGEKFVKFIY